MPEDRVETQEEVIIEQLSYGLLDFKEAKDLYGDDKGFFEHLLSSDEWSIGDLCVCVDLKDPNLFDTTKNIVLDAYKSTPDLEVLYYLPSKLQHDKKVVLTAVSSSPWELEAVPRAFKDDKEVVMAAVSVDGEALELASKRLRDDKEVVMAAISNSGEALIKASPRLIDDKDVVMAAISKGWDLCRVCERLKYDKDVYLTALLKDPSQCYVYQHYNLLELELKTLPTRHKEIIYEYYISNSGEEDVFLLAKAKKHFLT